MSSLADDLLLEGLSLRETHISRVFLGADRVYKVKKPVDLGFLDFRTLEARRRACDAELVLNRRLAPDVYLGLVPIALDAGGRHRLGAAGEPVDWAVEMRRLPDADAAEARLRAGRLERADVHRIGAHIADFHARARSDAETARFGSLAVIRGNVIENFEQTRESAPRYVASAAVAEVERWQLGFLDTHAALFERRAAQGRVRDGHGDLRLEHVYLDDAGGIEIIDCIEFNERFRYADVCADLAFLGMDLAWHGAPLLAEALLAAYARASGDWDLYAIVNFYESYRAYVRGKVSAMLADDVGAAPESRERAARDARKYFLLAQACEREPTAPPVLYAVAGLIASGKSTVADAISAATGAPVVDTDRTRKELAGVAATARLTGGAFTGAYAPGQTERVYAEAVRRAGIVLASGRSVVLDASFRTRELRALARTLAREHGAELRCVECRAPEVVARSRLAQRAQGPSVSDGDLRSYAPVAAAWEDIAELPAAEHVVLDTTRPLAGNLQVALGASGLTSRS